MKTNVKDKFTNIKNSILSDNEVDVDLKNVDERLEKIANQRKELISSNSDKEILYKKIKKSIIEIAGKDFFNKDSFKDFLEWIEDKEE